MESELDEYRMIIKQLEETIHKKDKEITKLAKKNGGGSILPILEQREEEEGEEERADLKKEEEDENQQAFINEQLMEEVRDLQGNEEKLMNQIGFLKEELEKVRGEREREKMETEHVRTIFLKFLEELNQKNKSDVEEYLKLLFSMLGVTEEDRETYGMIGTSIAKSMDKKKSLLSAIFKK